MYYLKKYKYKIGVKFEKIKHENKKSYKKGEAIKCKLEFIMKIQMLAA